MFSKKRPDGTYLPNLHFFTQLLPYLMPARKDAVIYFEKDMNVTKTLEYIRRKKKEDVEPKVSLFYIVLYAAVRVLALRPRMNRFVSGHRYYQRNSIRFNFVAKRDLTDDGEEVNVTMSFSPFSSMLDFCKKIDTHILSIKEGSTTGSEKINSLVSSLPRFLIKFFVGFIKFLDYHNMLPKSVLNSLPFWCSVFFTYVGSVGIDAPFHHNFDVGNCGIFCAIGRLRKENLLKADGTIEKQDRIRFTFTYDDRITDGLYCARLIDMLRDLIENPEKLEVPLELTQEQLAELALAKSELES
jgi:hypothetical protein